MIDHLFSRHSPNGSYRLRSLLSWRNLIVKSICIAFFTTLLLIGLNSCFLAESSNSQSSNSAVNTVVYPQDANMVNIKQYGAKGGWRY